MSDLPWLTIIGAVPLGGSIVVMLLPKGRDLLAKQLTLAISVITLILTLIMAVQFKPHGPRFQFTQTYDWIRSFGVHYAVGVDGIALVLIAMSVILVPLVVLSSWHDADPDAPEGVPRGSVKAYFAWLLLLETMMIGVFAATDVFMFYLFFEAMLVPIYFMIGSYGGPRRSYAAVKFLLYSLFGGLLMLVALIFLYVLSARAGQGTFLLSSLQHLHIAVDTGRWMFLGFFVAFAIKAPLWPVHTWLPDAAAEAPTGAAVLLVGVLDKVGTFGMIRYCLTLFPEASHWFAPAIVVLSLISIIYGALVAIGQTDLKRLIAYTSVSHFGFIGLGIFVLTSQGQSGATLYMVNHGFSTGALFLVVGFMIARRRSRGMYDFGGVQKVAPLLAGTFLVAGMSSLALPGLNNFVSEFLVLIGSFSRYKAAGVVAAVGIILAAIYILVMYQRTMNGPVSADVEGWRDLSLRERWIIGPLVVLIIGLGFYPKPVLDVINPAVQSTLQQVHAHDPAPEIGASLSSGGNR